MLQVHELLSDQVESITAEDQVQRRPIRFQNGNNGFAAEGWIARLFALRGDHAIASSADGIGVGRETHVRLLHGSAPEVGSKSARFNDGNAEAERGDFLGQRFGQSFHREFCHVIEADSGKGRQPTDRADVDDMSTPALAHTW